MLTLHSKKMVVDRNKLLHDLRRNLENHRGQYAQAMRDYKTALIIQLQDALKKAKAVNIPNIERIRDVEVEFDVPVSHEDEFLRAIRILEYMDKSEVEIDEDTFNAYVLNEWTWSRAFLSNSAKYASIAGRTGAGMRDRADVGRIRSK